MTKEIKREIHIKIKEFTAILRSVFKIDRSANVVVAKVKATPAIAHNGIERRFLYLHTFNDLATT